MNYMTYAVIAILVVFMLIGYIKGLVGELTTLIALVLAVIGLALVMLIVDNALDKEYNDALFILLFLLIFIMLVQAIKVFLKTVKFLAKFPIINGANKLLGTLVGMAEGVVVVWVCFILISKYDLFNRSAEMLMMVKANKFTDFLYDTNLFLTFFKH